MNDPTDTPLGVPSNDWATIEARYHALAKLTQNHVYAWLALQARGLQYEAALAAGDPNAQLTIPAWCAEYFMGLAEHIPALANGEDVRLPYPAPGEPIPPAISPDAAMELVPHALALTRQGYNAFRNYRSDADAVAEYMSFRQLREQGLKYEEALNALSKEVGALEASARRRRVTRGKKVLDTGKTSPLGSAGAKPPP